MVACWKAQWKAYKVKRHATQAVKKERKKGIKEILIIEFGARNSVTIEEHVQVMC